MSNQPSDVELVRDDLAGAAARMSGVSSERVFPYGVLAEFLEEFLKMLCRPSCTLVCAGLTTPEIAIAADKADSKLCEIIGESPFTVDLKVVISAVNEECDVIYVANPNRVSGSCASVKDLAHLAGTVPRGFLIVDETLYDYSGVTGLSLLEDCPNVIILRSFTVPFGIHSSCAGFGITGKRLITNMNDSVQLRSVSKAMRQAIVAAIEDGEATVSRHQEIHDEALRLAVALTHLGVQCRLAAADFLLMRVASPKDAGNFLVAGKVPVDNLDGYPGKKNYLRYRISSRESNDRLLEAFDRMPANYVKMQGFDRRAVSLYRRRATDSTQRAKRRPASLLLSERLREQNLVNLGADK